MHRKKTPITLDDLPKFTRWPAILLGQEEFAPRRRTARKVLREYNQDKWGAVLKLLRRKPDSSFTDLLRAQGADPDAVIAYSEGTRLFTGSAQNVFDEYFKMLLGAVRALKPGVLVELGSGAGDKILRIVRELRLTHALGGEYTPSGVECGRILAQQHKLPINFERFDFNNPATLRFVPAGAVVYTSHAIEQIPQLKEGFVAGLIRRKPRRVIHFEPCFEDHGSESVLSLMRRRYTEVNDYNRNLRGLLEGFAAKGKIRILEHRADVFGISPFNSSSLIVWEPSK